MAVDSRRLRVLKGLTALFQAIHTDEGFKIDMPENSVFRGRAVFGDNDPVPMISILEAPVPPDQAPVPEDSDSNDALLELIVQGFTTDDKVNPTDAAHVLLTDAKMALAREKAKETEGTVFGYKWVRRIIIGLGVVRPPDEISTHSYFWMPVTIDFVDDLLDPYDLA